MVRKEKTSDTMIIHTFLSKINLNVNGLKAPTNRQEVVEWIKQQQDSSRSCLQETHFRPKDTSRLKVRKWRNTLHAHEIQKKPGIAILLSDKIDFKSDCNKR